MKLTEEQKKLVKRWISLHWSIQNFLAGDAYYEEEEGFDFEEAQREFHEIKEILGLNE